MSVSDWLVLGGIAVAIAGGGLGWLLRIERNMLTREDHEKICQERNATVQRSVDDLRDDMERRHTENRKSFDKIETGVTGTHQRLDSLYRDLLNQKQGGR